MIGSAIHSERATQIADPGKRDERGNVIVIGLDSLRRDALLAANATYMPNLYRLRQNAFVNTNVVSPLARTFPAWVTILTGKTPSMSGARENHAPQENIDRSASVAWDFKRAGYRTVYATDETRFSYILPEFGFEQVIGPQKGVTDFLMSQFGDLPLVNFAVQLPYAEWVLPALVGNRAFAHAYRPKTFVGRLRREMGPSNMRPAFIAIHLCTAHWPYFIAEDTAEFRKGLPTDASPTSATYRSMLRVLDIQVGQILEMLKSTGYIDSRTMIVTLADHGEGFPKDDQVATVKGNHGSSATVIPVMGGHGATLLDPDQWRVFVSLAGHSNEGRIMPGESDQLASLEDVAPTLRRMARLGQPALLPNERLLANPILGHRTYVKLETGWRPGGLNLMNPSAGAALKIARSSYEIRNDGLVELKPDAYGGAIASKDIGITNNHHSLIASKKGGEELLVLHDIDQGIFHVLPSSPEPVWSAANIPLMTDACGEPEIRSRITAWCTEQR